MQDHDGDDDENDDVHDGDDDDDDDVHGGDDDVDDDGDDDVHGEVKPERADVSLCIASLLLHLLKLHSLRQK